MSPQQQVFNAVYAASIGLGYSTFDFLPAKETEYPFVFIGEQFDQDRRTKQHIFGNVQQTIHFYHDYRQRSELTAMMDNLKVELRSLKRTPNFYITCKNITGQIIIDDSTAQTLLHGIVEVEFTFN